MSIDHPIYFARNSFEITKEIHSEIPCIVITFEGESKIKFPLPNGVIPRKIPLITLQFILSNAKVKGYTKLKSVEANRVFRIIFQDRIDEVLKNTT